MSRFHAIKSAVAVRARAYLPHPPKPAILMYHRIASETFDPWNLAVTAENFGEQLAWLAKRRTVLSLTEFADLHQARKLPRDAVALTFDDGYACTAEIAAPLLNSARLAATIFIPAEQISRGRMFWWDELQQIVIEHNATTLALSGEQIDIGGRDERDWHLDANSGGWTPRQWAFYRLWQRLRTLHPDQLGATMSELRAQGDNRAVRPTHRLMTPAEARSIRSEQIEFGSHALSHASLPNLSPRERAREIGESRKACEALTGAVPSTFAYPFGDYDLGCETLVREAGYKCACTIEPSAVRRDSSLFALPRVQVGNWPARKLAKELHAL